MDLVDIINRVARYVPGRRKRKLHIGLFGYSRSMGNVSLPRAITFTAALYSLGVPPELLGFNALSSGDLEFIEEVYPGLGRDLHDAARYANPESPFLSPEVKSSFEEYLEPEYDEGHMKTTEEIIRALRINRTANLQELILEAASQRKFLG